MWLTSSFVHMCYRPTSACYRNVWNCLFKIFVGLRLFLDELLNKSDSNGYHLVPHKKAIQEITKTLHSHMHWHDVPPQELVMLLWL